MSENGKKISVQPNGPYIVEGGIPLVRKSPVMSEHGEPLTWKKEETLRSGERYALCRCGQSAIKPFCDGTHMDVDFDGSETAETNSFDERQTTYRGTKVFVKDDRALCIHAGFCGTRLTNVWKMTKESDESTVRAQIMSMVDNCPSGALAYTLERSGETNEPDLPEQIAVTPDGALWVSGSIPIERADGQPLETRNRVTLCRCGKSSRKPLCDGTHKEAGFTDS